jgi:Zn-dependent protease
MPALVLTLVLMSMARAYVADMLGDPTPRRMGLLTVNPAAHVDPVGTLAIPAMLALIGAPVFGWGKGFMLDSDNYRRPRADAAVVAIIGPVVALLVAAIAAVLAAALYDSVSSGADVPVITYLFRFLIALVTTGCLLALFNLLPIPGFDGGKIVELLLPRDLAAKFAGLAQYSLLLLVALVVIMPMLSPELDIVRKVIAPMAMEIATTFLWGAGIPIGS